MRVWILRRRDGGAYLPEPVRVGGTPAPFELLVVDVTDQGKRRPSKVARIYAPGSKAIIAELACIKLVWLKGFEFVLQGVDTTANERGAIQAAQSWMCKLDEPPDTVGFRMRAIYDRGLALPRRQVMDRPSYVSEGKLAVGEALNEHLNRHVPYAIFDNPYGSGAVLHDCELDWVGESTFQLSGFQHYEAYADQPARLLRQAWIIEFDIKTPEQVAFIRSLAPKPQR
jgi:hypothetical protein